MIKSITLFILLMCISFSVSADTLIIDAKKLDETQYRHMEYVYVYHYGYNATGTFIIRFYNGTEISLGKRSHWDKFNYRSVDDDDHLVN